MPLHPASAAGAPRHAASAARPVRPVAAACVAGMMLLGIAAMFWFQDWRYSRPTPVPAGWSPVAVGTVVQLPAAIDTLRTSDGRPVLLHFVDPTCPCSRFNVDHVRDLIRAHGAAIRFVAVLTQGDAGTMVAEYDALGLDIPYYVDDGRLAASVGAYSTPQAALLDATGHLVYRGNYNTSRYCRDRQTEFARLAIEAVLAGDEPRVFPPAAVQAWGCPLRHPRPTATEARS